MQQLSLFDLRENGNDIELRVKFPEDVEEDLKKTMALALIEIHKKGADDHGKTTGA